MCAYVTANGKKVSDDVSGTVTTATKPAKPTVGKVTAKKNAITLKWKKTYYVKIRAYRKVGSKVYRGAYSAKKTVKVK